jgi:hypothetical protein
MASTVTVSRLATLLLECVCREGVPVERVQCAMSHPEVALNRTAPALEKAASRLHAATVYFATLAVDSRAANVVDFY